MILWHKLRTGWIKARIAYHRRQANAYSRHVARSFRRDRMRSIVSFACSVASPTPVTTTSPSRNTSSVMLKSTVWFPGVSVRS